MGVAGTCKISVVNVIGKTYLHIFYFFKEGISGEKNRCVDLLVLMDFMCFPLGITGATSPQTSGQLSNHQHLYFCQC